MDKIKLFSITANPMNMQFHSFRTSDSILDEAQDSLYIMLEQLQLMFFPDSSAPYDEFSFTVYQANFYEYDFDRFIKYRLSEEQYNAFLQILPRLTDSIVRLMSKKLN